MALATLTFDGPRRQSIGSRSRRRFLLGEPGHEASLPASDGLLRVLWHPAAGCGDFALMLRL